MNEELIDAVKLSGEGSRKIIEDLFERHCENQKRLLYFLYDKLDLSYLDTNGVSVIKWCVLNNDLISLKVILNLAFTAKLLNNNSIQPILDDSLYCACKNDNPQIAKVLLEYGANPNVFIDGNTPLSISFRPQYVTRVYSKVFEEDVYQINGNAKDLIELLLKAGANPNVFVSGENRGEYILIKDLTKCRSDIEKLFR